MLMNSSRATGRAPFDCFVKAIPRLGCLTFKLKYSRTTNYSNIALDMSPRWLPVVTFVLFWFCLDSM